MQLDFTSWRAVLLQTTGPVRLIFRPCPVPVAMVMTSCCSTVRGGGVYGAAADGGKGETAHSAATAPPTFRQTVH